MGDPLQESGLAGAFSSGGDQEFLAGIRNGCEGVLLDKVGGEFLLVHVVCSFVAEVKSFQGAVHGRAVLGGGSLWC
jgi:hypothetical protein